MAMQFHSTKPSSGFTCHSRSPSKKYNTSHKLQAQFTRRRIAAAVALASVFSDSKTALSFEFSITVPDQTIEEAEAGIKKHAQELLSIKKLIDSETWKAAQIALRESSARLKQDLYTIIQAEPGSQRPQLRKLYSNLFNNVTDVWKDGSNKILIYCHWQWWHLNHYSRHSTHAVENGCDVLSHVSKKVHALLDMMSP